METCETCKFATRLIFTDEARELLRDWRRQLFDFGQMKGATLPDDHDEWENFANQRTQETADAWCSYALMLGQLVDLGGNVGTEGDMLYGTTDRIAYGVTFRDNEFSIHT